MTEKLSSASLRSDPRLNKTHCCKSQNMAAMCTLTRRAFGSIDACLSGCISTTCYADEAWPRLVAAVVNELYAVYVCQAVVTC